MLKNVPNSPDYFFIYGELVHGRGVETPKPKIICKEFKYRRYNIIHCNKNCPVKYDFKYLDTLEMFKQLVALDKIFLAAKEL